MFVTSLPANRPLRLASSKQVAFITSLSSERGQPLPSFASLSTDAASRMITTLLAMPRAATTTTGTTAAPLEVGMYRNDAGEIFKVQESATGNRYAKKLVPIGGQRLTEIDETVRFEFEYAPGAIKSLTAAQRLTLDEAKAFGIKYGVCCVCNRTLSDAKSVALGIGPVCITKL